jgi:hypothetical protein
LWQIIAEYDALKLSDSKIAKIVYGDASKANLVAAHLARARRKPESRKLKAG